MLVAALLLGACSREDLVDRALGRQGPDPWARDSALLASEPDILLRLLPSAGGARVVPIASLGTRTFGPLALTGRGWRALDQELLQTGRNIHPVDAGRSQDAVRMFQGYWQPQGGTLDTVPRCGNPIPMGYAITPGGRATLPSLATRRSRDGAPPPAAPIAPADLDLALRSIPPLVAPPQGITAAELARYERRVHAVASGVAGGSTLLVAYTDPVPPPDDVAAYDERPRQLIVAMDRGVYGYRPTWTYATVGGPRARPMLAFLDALDADGDGRAELFFGLRDPSLAPLYTMALRYENDAWRQVFEFRGGRCGATSAAP